MIRLHSIHGLIKPRLALWFVIGVSAVVAARTEKADRGLTLPQWIDGSDTGLVDSGLWPDNFNAALIVHPATLSPGQSESEPEQTEESWLRFLPRGLFSNRKPQPAAEPALTDISAEALRAGENAPGDTRLLDPQGILGEAQTEDLIRLLAYHAENAGVEARFLLLDAGQQLPAGADLSRMASGALADSSACLVVYPLGAPQRARLFLTRNVTQAAPAGYLETLAAACRREAEETPDSVEQLQRFATQLSIRLFWLERAYPAVKPEINLPALPADKPPEPLAAPALSEITLPTREPALEPIPFTVIRRLWLPYVGIAAAGILAIALTCLMLARWRRRRQSQTVWLLPDSDMPHDPRFGGPHCGACGASVKYG